MHQCTHIDLGPYVRLVLYINALLTNNTGSDRDSLTKIGRTCHVTSPIWSRIDWVLLAKVLLSSKWVKILYLTLSWRSKHQLQ